MSLVKVDRCVRHVEIDVVGYMSSLGGSTAIAGKTFYGLSGKLTQS